jgi:Protein of unknown function (DUF4058)
MPILDHFHPPLSGQRMWSAFHHAWAATIARHLNRHVLPDGYFAAPNVQFGARVEIDVGTFEASPASSRSSGSHATLTSAAEPATITIPAIFPDTIEVVVSHQEGGAQLVAVVELVSPSNKDRPESRRVFAAKMATYLSQGISLVVVDIVTSRTSNLHNEWIALVAAPVGRMPEPTGASLYANAYRPVQRKGQAEIDVWLYPLHTGSRLPSVPLFLRAEVCVALPLEETYVETCQDQRIALNQTDP